MTTLLDSTGTQLTPYSEIHRLPVPDTVRLTGAANPFSNQIVDVAVPEGLTVLEMLQLVQPDPALLDNGVVFVGDQLVPKKHWRRVRPKAGVQVTMRAHPLIMGGGGGKNILRTVLSLAVVAAVVFLAGPLGAVIAPALGVSAATGTAIAGALISGVGGLLVNMLAPVRPPDLGDLSAGASPSLFLEGSSNRANPFGPIPQVLGFVRYRLPLAAATYTEALGDQNILRMLLTAGLGRVTINDIQIGDTPIEEFEDYDIEIRQGRDTDEPVTLYTNTVDQEAFSTLLDSDNGFTSRFTSEATDAISIDITFPKGLIRIGAKNDYQPAVVTVQIEWGPVGGPYHPLTQDIAEFSFEGATFTNEGVIEFRATRPEAIRYGIRWNTGERGQYEVRVRRVLPNATNTKISDETVWTLLQSFTLEPTVTPPVPMSLVALRFRATDQLNGSIDTLSAMTKTVALDWDGSAWVYRETNNPASLYRHVLQGSASAQPIGNNRIDLDKLAEWHDFCTARGFTYNRVHDFNASMYEVLQGIASAGRARVHMVDGKWSVVIDEARDYPVQVITPRNSWDFQIEKPFFTRPDAFRVRFADEEAGFEQDEVLVPLVGKTLDTARVFEAIEFPGVTNRTQCYRMARFQAALLENRPEEWSVKMDFEHLVATIGDRVLVQHDVMLVGRAAGRITARVLDGSDIVSVDIDETVDFLDGETYQIVVRHPRTGDVSSTHTVTGSTAAEGTQTLVFVSRPDATSGPQIGDLVAFGTTNSVTEDALISGIVPGEDLSATLKLHPYRAAVYDIADNAPIPAYTPKITETTRLPALSINRIVTDESVLELVNDAAVERVMFSVRNIGRENAFIEVQQRASNSIEPWKNSSIINRGADFVRIGSVTTNELLNFRLRWNISGGLTPGPWTHERRVRVIGKSGNPAPLQNVSALAVEGAIIVRWDMPEDLDVQAGGFVAFRIAESETTPSLQTWKNSRLLGQMVQARALSTTLPLKVGTIFARVRDSYGRWSDVVEVDLSVPTDKGGAATGTISVFDSGAFTGTKDNLTTDGGSLVMATAALTVDDIPEIDSVFDFSDWSGDQLHLSGTYGFTNTQDLGAVQDVRVIAVVRAFVDDLQPTIDQWEQPMDDWEDVYNPPAMADYWLELQFSDDNITYSPWQKFDIVDIRCRYFNVRLQMRSEDQRFSPRVYSLGYRYRSLEDINRTSLTTSGSIIAGSTISATGSMSAANVTSTGAVSLDGYLTVNSGRERPLVFTLADGALREINFGASVFGCTIFISTNNTVVQNAIFFARAATPSSASLLAGNSTYWQAYNTDLTPEGDNGKVQVSALTNGVFQVKNWTGVTVNIIFKITGT